MVHFGLGDAAAVDILEVLWPSGVVDRFTSAPMDQRIEVIEGRGAPDES
jgi:hypothetical protein